MGAPTIGNTSLSATRPSLPEGSQDFVAEHGDTFGSVAKQLGIDEDELRKANPQAANPEGLYPGQRLTVPGSPQPGRDGATAVDAATPGRPSVGATIKDGAVSASAKISAADPVEGRSTTSELGASADKNGIKATARVESGAQVTDADGSKVKGESTTTVGAGADNKGVGVNLAADRKTTSTQPDGSSSVSSTSTTGNVRIGEDGISFGGSRKNGTETKGPEGTLAGTSESTENKGNVTLSRDSIGGTVGSERTSSNTDARGRTTSTKQSQDTSVKLGADSFHVDKTFGREFTRKAPGNAAEITAGISLNIKADGATASKDGTTTSSIGAETSVALKGNASIGGKAGKAPAKTPLRWSLEGNITAGLRVSAETRVPDAQAKGKDTSPVRVNPLDPDSMPKGSQFTLDTAAFVNTDVKAGIGIVRAQAKSSAEDGFTVLAEKTDTNRIRLTAGPTAALSVSGGLGVDVGVASAMLGRGDKFSDAKLTSAEFDLSDPQGRASYREALLTGQFPTDNGAGVADVKTIQKLDAATQVKLDGSLASFGFSVKGTGSTVSDVITTRPGNLVTRETTVQYDDNVPLVITRKYDADQKELIDERMYTYKVDIGGEPTAVSSSSLMNVAPSAIPPGKQATSREVSFTQADMSKLKGLAAHAVAKDLANDAEVRKLTGDSANGTFDTMSNEDLSVALIKGMGSTNGEGGGFMQHLKNIFVDSKIVRGADGLPQLLDDAQTRLPGTVRDR